MSAEQEKKEGPRSIEEAKEINILKSFNALLEEIPWEDLRELPKKLRKLEDHPIAKALGVKNLGKVDIENPIRDVVNYVGIVVLRLRGAEKDLAAQQKEIDELKERLAALEASS